MAEMSMTVVGTDDLLAALPKRMNARRVMAAGAAEYKELWRSHFQALDAAGNKRGFAPKGFWTSEGVRKTDIAELDDEHAVVSCGSRAVALKATVGPYTIKPRTAGALAIPLSARAYAAGWPSNSGIPLEFVPIHRGHVVGKLVEAAATSFSFRRDGTIRRGKSNAKTVGVEHYLLMDAVTIMGMGDAVMPDRGSAETNVTGAMYAEIGRQIDRAQK